MDLQTGLVIAVALLLAGAVKGMLGLGLPLVALGLLAFVLPPQQAAVVMLAPIFVTNAWQVLSMPGAGRLTRRLSVLLVATLAATFVSAGVLTAEHADTAKMILGGAIVTYGLFVLSGFRPRVAPRNEPWLAPPVGAATGIIAGATGVVLVPVVAYLQAIGYEKDELVQAQSLVFLVAGIALASSLLLQRQITPPQALVSFLAVIPAGIGIVAGQSVRGRLDIDTFRSVFCVALICLGLYILVTAAF